MDCNDGKTEDNKDIIQPDSDNVNNKIATETDLTLENSFRDKTVEPEKAIDIADDIEDTFESVKLQTERDQETSGSAEKAEGVDEITDDTSSQSLKPLLDGHQESTEEETELNFQPQSQLPQADHLKSTEAPTELADKPQSVKHQTEGEQHSLEAPQAHAHYDNDVKEESSKIKNIVEEEIRKHLEINNRKQMMVQSTISAAVGVVVGIFCMLPFKPSNIQNTSIPIAVGPDNVTYGYYNHSKDIDIMKMELLQCQANFTKIQDMETDILQCQDNVTKLQDMKTDLAQCQTNFTKLRDDVLFMKRDLNLVNGTIEIQEYKYITLNEGLFVLIIFGIIEGLVFWLFVKHFILNQKRSQIPGQSDEHNQNTNTSIPQSPRSTKILDTISRVSLEMSVGIISFYQETQNLHKTLVESAMKSNIPIKVFMMRNPETQIKQIPTCKVIFVFVDYNERNIVLETQGQDLGDKKVVTVQAAQKMGADVFVGYVRDKGSKKLPHGHLYNQELSSFTKHYVLKQVTQRNRGLSVYETFTDYQKEHIRGVIDSHF